MDIQKFLLKIAYLLVALSILVLIGFTFYARHVMTGQSQNAPAKKTEIEETSNIQFSGMSLTIEKDKMKKDVTGIKEAVKKDKGDKTGEQ